MTSKGSRLAAASSWRPLAAWAGAFRRGGRGGPLCWARTLAARALAGAALVLLGAVIGLAAGQAMAKRSAHRTGACIALNMASALGYLDDRQQRQVRHALTTALNPGVDLFAGSRPSLDEACGAEP